MLHFHEMKSLLAAILALSTSAMLLAAGGKYRPDAPESDPVGALQLRQDQRVARCEIHLAKNVSQPTVLAIRELKSVVHGIGVDEDNSISDAFSLTGGKPARSLPSAELAAHLEVMKSVRKVENLLEQAREATEARQSQVARLRLAAAAKELTSTRKLIAAKTKNRGDATLKSLPDPKAKKPKKS